MRRLPRIVLLVALVAIVPVLAGCSNFDPDSLDVFGLNSKPKLKGKRELLFPNGVPGVTQGIPPQYEEGYHAPAISDLPPGDADATPPAAKTTTAKSVAVKPVRASSLGKPMVVHKPTRKRTVRRKVRSKTRHHLVKRKPAPKPKATATAAKPKGTTAPWPSTPPQQAAAPKTGTSAPWPSTNAQQQQQQESQAGWPGGQQQQQQKLAPWPSAPPSGTFSK